MPSIAATSSVLTYLTVDIVVDGNYGSAQGHTDLEVEPVEMTSRIVAPAEKRPGCR